MATEAPNLRDMPLEKLIERSQVLVEALPYIRAFRGATVVIKYGGAAMVDEGLKSQVIQDIALMAIVGMNPVVVHGGGPEITAHLKRLGKQAQFIDGQRVTDEETLDVAEMVLAGKINSEVVLDLNRAGVRSVGLSGKDMGLITAKKLLIKKRSVVCREQQLRIVRIAGAGMEFLDQVANKFRVKALVDFVNEQYFSIC